MQSWQVTKEQRRKTLEDAAARRISILFATQLAREGLDLPNLNIGHMASPKKGDQYKRKDGASVEQEIGRIMRPDKLNPNKVATWYDYVDYNVGVFQTQYYTRRKVYERLGLKLGKKPRTATDNLDHAWPAF
jgi:superfamily II DNA or RNA helicase